MHPTHWLIYAQAASRASTPPLAIPFAIVQKEIRHKLAEHRAWTELLRYTPGIRYYHVTYEQLTDVAACVEIKILRRVRAESSRRPPRHRRVACSMAWRCRFLTARRSQHDRVIAEK